MSSSAGVIAVGKGADVGVGNKAARKRAVGTREHIVAYLAEVHELLDANGMASTQLAAAVGYPGSSVAFAQLLSSMERSGLIERDVRGKRTYRISLGPAERAATAGPAETGLISAAVGSGAVGSGAVGSGAVGSGAVGSGAVGSGAVGSGAGTGGFDYDELARRLLIQVVRRLAAAEPEAGEPDPSALAAENVRLREELAATQRLLALAAERLRKRPITTDLDSKEVVVLQRLLSLAAQPVSRSA